jgi:hypothetical protein
MRTPALALVLAAASMLAAGCSAATTSDADVSEDEVTSNEAGFVDFDFDSTLETARGTDAQKAITAQLFYTIGPLTSFGANGRVGQAETTNLVTKDGPDGRSILTFHVKLPVAWPKGKSIPRSYAVVLPLRVDAQGLDAFASAYDGTCGKSEYGSENYWHDFNPTATGCKLADGDVTRTKSTVRKAKNFTTGKYPEYDQVWSDKALKVVAIFGAAGSSTDANDEGVQQYEAFMQGAQSSVPGATKKENAPPSSVTKDVTVAGTIRTNDGVQNVAVTGLLMDTLYTAGPAFEARYAELSKDADLVLYNGHSELSKNTNALARLGTVTKGKYQIFFFDSCDTFAYLDTALTDRRVATNGAASDPKGTRYLDIVTNVLPSYFFHYADNSLAVFRALLTPDAPKSYNELLTSMPKDQIVVVSGEEDNAFVKR